MALLRINETLTLFYQNITYSESHITLKIEYRKNLQGKSESFVLHRNDREHYLCPVRAFLSWIAVRGDSPGPLFYNEVRNKIVDKPIPYAKIQSWLAEDLQKFIKDWDLYTTHTFRRGGCQFYNMVRKKSVTEILHWGGWNDISIMLRYMLGPQKSIETGRDYFTKPPEIITCDICKRKLNRRS